MESAASVALGIDENGLGPRLGPLVVTAVWAREENGGHAHRRARGAMRARLDDSKRLVAHGNVALGEAWARAIASRMGMQDATDPPGLLRALLLDDEKDLRAPCPGSHGDQCWNAEAEAFSADTALLRKVEKDLERLAAQGVEVVRAACVVVCAKRLNEGVDRGLTRFDMDLHAMERLALYARARTGL
jgi:hypothetical protein